MWCVLPGVAREARSCRALVELDAADRRQSRPVVKKGDLRGSLDRARRRRRSISGISMRTRCAARNTWNLAGAARTMRRPPGGIPSAGRVGRLASLARSWAVVRAALALAVALPLVLACRGHPRRGAGPPPPTCSSRRGRASRRGAPSSSASTSGAIRRCSPSTARSRSGRARSTRACSTPCGAGAGRRRGGAGRAAGGRLRRLLRRGAARGRRAGAGDAAGGQRGHAGGGAGRARPRSQPRRRAALRRVRAARRRPFARRRSRRGTGQRHGGVGQRRARVPLLLRAGDERVPAMALTLAALYARRPAVLDGRAAARRRRCRGAVDSGERRRHHGHQLPGSAVDDGRAAGRFPSSRSSTCSTAASTARWCATASC